MFNEANKKCFHVIVLILSLSNFVHAQNIKTKDGVFIGSRDELIAPCIKIIDDALANYKYKPNIDSKEFCNCILDSIFPMINYNELDQAGKNIDLAGLILKYKDSFRSCQCLKSININLGISSCVGNYLNYSIGDENFSLEQAINFCYCYVPKLYESGNTYKDENDIDDKNSPFYNEIFLPCLNNVLKGSLKNDSLNSYVPNDILGGGSISKVQLTDYLGKGFKVKIIINGISQYFLFDTGASIMMINSETERELIKNGALKKSNYLEKQEFIIADGSKVLGQVVKLNNVVIGDYTVNNVRCAIVKNGSLLCGKGFLDKFQKWYLDKEKLNLILYK